MPSERHILVGDWASGDLDPERQRLRHTGISLSESGILGTDSADEKHAKLKTAVGSTARIDALLFCIAPVDAEIIGLLPESCQLLQRCGTGLDNVDLEAAAGRGMTVRNTPQYCVEEVAVHAMGMLLSLHRHLPGTHERLLRGEWSAKTPQPIRRLSTQTLGELGFRPHRPQTGRAAAAARQARPLLRRSQRGRNRLGRPRVAGRAAAHGRPDFDASVVDGSDPSHHQRRIAGADEGYSPPG